MPVSAGPSLWQRLPPGDTHVRELPELCRQGSPREQVQCTRRQCTPGWGGGAQKDQSGAYRTRAERPQNLLHALGPKSFAQSNSTLGVRGEITGPRT